MKKNTVLAILVAFVIALNFTACDKSDSNSSDDGFISAYTNTTITGIVFDENHIPVKGAKVVAHGQTRYSDANGIFVFQKISVPKERCFVTITYNNSFAIMRSKPAVAGGVTRLDAHLISYDGVNSETNVFTTGTAYTVNLSDGSSIEFPLGTDFVDQNGTSYQGNIIVRTSVLDATTDAYSRRAPAGDQIGLDKGSEMLLQTQTGLMIELSDDNGNPLNLAPNSTANIAAQIPASLQGTAPSTASGYYASTSNGYNNREGGATENGGKYEQTVGHFSYWSTQVASPDYGTIKCRVIDASSHTLTGVRVQVGTAYGITGNDGTFEMKVPAGVDMDIAIRPLDFYGISISSPELAWASGETRLVELQLSQNLDRTVGTIVDCDNNPIEAQVSLSWENNVSSTFTTNGQFDLPSASASPSYQCQLHIVTDDYETILSVDVSQGTNNLGTINVCPTELPDIHNYVQVNQGDTLLLDYTNFYTTYKGVLLIDSATNNPINTSITVSGSDGQISITVDEASSTGEYTIGDGASAYFSSNNPSASYQLETGTVKILQYDDVGGRIKGVVDGTTMYDDNVHIEFEVIRAEDEIDSY